MKVVRTSDDEDGLFLLPNISEIGHLQAIGLSKLTGPLSRIFHLNNLMKRLKNYMHRDDELILIVY